SGTGTGKQTGTRGRVLKTFAFCDTPADLENFFMNIRMFDQTGSHLQTLVNVQAAAKSQVHTAGKTGTGNLFAERACHKKLSCETFRFLTSVFCEKKPDTDNGRRHGQNKERRAVISQSRAQVQYGCRETGH